MTPKQITTLAHHRLVPPWIMKLVMDLVAAHEREACAKVCEDYDSRTWMEHRFNMADEISETIRSRK